jgi:hypothetical protein
VNLALPPVSVAVPRVVFPSLKVTVPVPPEGVTVAVNVTDCPKVVGLADEVIAVVVVATSTTWTTAGEVLAEKLLSPSYAAVIEWLPAARLEVVKLALPSVSAAVPSVVAPSLNVTVPAAAPPDEVTMATKVTGWPTLVGFADDVNVVAVLAWLTV